MKMNLKNISFLFLVSLFLLNCKSTIHTAKVEPLRYSFDAENPIGADTEIAALIAPYKSQLDAEMNQVIGQTAKKMVKTKPESVLGNWLSDLLYKKTVEYYKKEVDVAIVNYGGIRVPTLPQGDITRSHIFELMPFDNLMVVVHVDGANFQKLCDQMAGNGGWPTSSQLRFDIVDGKAKNIQIKGQAFQMDQTYKVSISDYVANGGDKCFFLKELPRDNLNKLVRDAILEYVEEQGKAGLVMDGALDGRIK